MTPVPCKYECKNCGQYKDIIDPGRVPIYLCPSCGKPIKELNDIFGYCFKCKREISILSCTSFDICPECLEKIHLHYDDANDYIKKTVLAFALNSYKSLTLKQKMIITIKKTVHNILESISLLFNRNSTRCKNTEYRTISKETAPNINSHHKSTILPSNNKKLSNPEVNILLERAESFIDLNNLQQALEYYNKIIENTTPNHHYFQRRAWIQRMLGKFDSVDR